MFERMKLKSYLLTVFTVIIVMAGVLTAVSVFGMRSIGNSSSELLDETIAADTAVKNCRIYVDTAAKDVREILLTDDASTKANLKSEIDECLAQARQNIESFKVAYGTEDGLAGQYESAFNSWVSIAQRILTEIDNGNNEAAREMVINECTPALNALVSIGRQIDQKTTAERATEEASVLRQITVFTWICIVVFIAVLVFSLMLAFKTTSQLTSVVKSIEEVITCLSKGDLQTSMDYKGSNEFGALAEHINFSFKEMYKYIETIDNAMEEFAKGNFDFSTNVKFLGDFSNIQTSIRAFRGKMVDVLRELDTASDQVNAGASQVASGAQALAQGATEQAGSVEDLSGRISEISEEISKSAEYAENANKLGEQAGEVVDKSRGEMKQMLQSIRDIAETSEDIQKIIKIIDDIAFQTNILALNAAVEAARAGNAGKGFAVVADEVRNLAQKSADAASNTAELIGKSLQHVKQGEELAGNTAEAFNAMAEQTTQILDMVAKIANSSRQEADAIANISQGVDQISSVVQMNSATSEESAAASEELSGQANVMKSLLGQFNIGEDSGYRGESRPSETRSSVAMDNSKY